MSAVLHAISNALSVARPCRDCGREYEATLRLPRCGDCHDRRLRDIQEQRASLSHPPCHTACPNT